MSPALRISVADDETDMREYFQEMLPLMGHEVVSVAADGQELVDQCETARPDLVIADIKMPELDGIEAGMEINRRHAIPVILVSAYHEVELLQRAEASHILAYLVKPVKRPDLETAISIAMRRFGQFQALQKEASELRQALEERKLIEHAKGVIIRHAHLDEPAAFRRMQQLASANNKKLVEIARIVLIGAEALSPVIPK